jgi:Fe-S-cluster containining protein
MTARAFERKYVYRTRHLLRLRKPPDSQCHFLRENGCAIHPVKPSQCRAFPFWPESIESPRAWRELGRGCPGIGKGQIVPFAAVQRIANEMRESYPGMYPVKAGGS